MSVIDHYLKEQGFIIPSNEIYGGYRGLYDYGPLGVLLKKNIQKSWENFFVITQENVHFMEGTILGSEQCWKASGHLDNFHDILIECRECNRRYREDHVENQTCPDCGGKKWTNPREFNLIFKTQNENLYLRPETAQSIFINFKNIQRITSSKLPFAIAQVGKAFRNEITMHNSIFRTLEFEQMECEWFITEEQSYNCFKSCIEQMQEFLTCELGISQKLIKVMEIPEEERAHYSKGSTDILFKYESGWGELWGLANRGTYDLTAHQNESGKSMEYIHQDTDSITKFIPNIVEHSVGLNRLMYAVITSSLEMTKERTILKLKPELAPYKFCVLPLTKQENELSSLIHKELVKHGIAATILKKGSIGKRYRKCDEIGTPYCITLDQESRNNLENPNFTIRDRDSTQQIRISMEMFRKNNYRVIFK